MTHCTHSPLYVATRHGVILGSGYTPAAAAAAAAAAVRVSHVEVHLADAVEAHMARQTWGRCLPADESALLEAIRADLASLQEGAAESAACGFDDVDAEVRFIEFAPHRYLWDSDETHVELKDAIRRIDVELAELPKRSRQRCLFAPAGAPA